MKLLCLLALSQAVLFGAEHKATAADVVELVYDSLYSDHDDGRLAQSLQQLKITEQLSPHVVRYFQHIGIGPHALQALQRLREESSPLTPPEEPALAIQPVPVEDEQKEMLERIERYAQSYARNLPNFICDQVTRRYSNLGGLLPDGNPLFTDTLHFTDSFTKSLRFIEGIEEGVAPNRAGGRKIKIATRRGQSISSGEFGTDMVIIFGPGIDPEMSWDHWQMFRGKRTAVFNYFVGMPKSRFTLLACCTLVPGEGEVRQRVIAPIRGLVYAEPETGVISRIAIQPVHLPEAFRLKESATVIDYGDVKIGGQSYTLPVKALAFVRGAIDPIPGSQQKPPVQKNRNEISFLNYRKFEAESVLTFSNSKITYQSDSKK